MDYFFPCKTVDPLVLIRHIITFKFIHIIIINTYIVYVMCFSFTLQHAVIDDNSWWLSMTMAASVEAFFLIKQPVFLTGVCLNVYNI
jgi:hypothetical protein